MALDSWDEKSLVRVFGSVHGLSMWKSIHPDDSDFWEKFEEKAKQWLATKDPAQLFKVTREFSEWARMMYEEFDRGVVLVDPTAVNLNKGKFLPQFRSSGRMQLGYFGLNIPDEDDFKPDDLKIGTQFIDATSDYIWSYDPESQVVVAILLQLAEGSFMIKAGIVDIMPARATAKTR